MKHLFTYETDQMIKIEKYVGDAADVCIPNAIDGTPVRALKPYAFVNLRFIEKIHLPESIQSIGNHCFYDCRNLHLIELWDSIDQIEDGILKNCLSFHDVVLHAKSGNLYALKWILSEINEEVLATIYYGDAEEKVQLLFPRYLHDYEENTMARIINQVTYGCGVHYRECIDDEVIDYQKYDQLFSFVKANEKEETISLVALLRLRYPYHLYENEKKIYEAYIEDNFVKCANRCMEKGDMENFEFLILMDLCKIEWLDQLLLAAQEQDKIEYVSLILRRKNEKFGRVKKVFEF